MTIVNERPSMLLACPHCAALWDRASGYDTVSRSMLNPLTWSDGAVTQGAEETPPFSEIIERCWRCQRFFWIREARRERVLKPEECSTRERLEALNKELVATYGDRMAPADSVRAEWRIQEALEDGIARSNREGIFLHQRWLQQTNDLLRKVFRDVLDYCSERRPPAFE